MSRSLKDTYADKQEILDAKDEFLRTNKSSRIQKVQAFINSLRLQTEDVSENDLITLNSVLTEAGNLVTIADIAAIGIEYLGILSEATLFSISAAGSIVGIVLVPVGSALEIIQAYGQNKRLFKMRAFAYSYTSWAFNLSKPEPSQTILKYIEEWAGSEEIPELINVWNETVTETYNKISNTVLEHSLKEHRCKEILKLISKADPIDLNLMIMRGMEENLDGLLLEIWKENYSVLFPN